jgi:hypothetical protein
MSIEGNTARSSGLVGFLTVPDSIFDGSPGACGLAQRTAPANLLKMNTYVSSVADWRLGAFGFDSLHPLHAIPSYTVRMLQVAIISSSTAESVFS